LAFKRNEVEIVVIDERTGAARTLPARASWPGLTWTADGTSLLFSWLGRMGEVTARLSEGLKSGPADTVKIGEHMNTDDLSNFSRRHFIMASLGGGALLLPQRFLFAEETGVMPTMIHAAISAFSKVPAEISRS
jgi:hypothetical protein